MGLHGMLLKVMLASIALTVATAQGMPGCQDSCGDLSIPYPFGTREGCYLNESFLITCTKSNPHMRKSDHQVLSISLEGQLEISVGVAYDCWMGNMTVWSDQVLSLSSFYISSTRNKLTAIGCDTFAIIHGYQGHRYTTGCMSLCAQKDDLINGTCSGIGCCQTTFPKGVNYFTVWAGSFNRHKGISDFNNCSYAFVVKDDYYNFSNTDIDSRFLRDSFKPVMVLDWAVGDTKCKQAQKNKASYLCHENSECYDWDDGPGYRCNCSKGYHGNPYLPSGCKDFNECDNSSLNDCTHICCNTAGSYTCLCPKGYHGDGKKVGQGCILDLHQSSRTKAIVGMSMSMLFMFVIISFLYWGIRKRNIIMRKERFFKKNGGIVLQQLLSNCKRESSDQKLKIFTEAELMKATNNFCDGNVIGRGGYGTVYKGILANDMVVAIKKSRIVDRGQIKQFINELIILCQIKHPNVVKLLGCCLETPVPLLVYELVTNNTLFHHVHDESRVSSMPWELRLRVAAETAGALAYMHSAPIHIIHRDIKSANILLDEDYTAKVSDFGASRLVPLGQTQLPTLVEGTVGYVDPEYLCSGLLTKKSDVYSFGVLLAELLTGKNVFSLDRPEEDRGLAMYFVYSLEEDRLLQILEDRVKKEGHVEQLKRVAEVAKKCLRLKGRERPTMKDVKEELEALRNFESTHESNLDQI